MAEDDSQGLLDRTADALEELLPNYRYILYVGVGVLVASYIGVYLVDVVNVFGLRSLFESFTVPALWDYMFTEAGPIEMIQWLFLLLLVTTSGYLAKRLGEEGRDKESMFWTLFFVGSVLMFLEDWGNIRHILFRQTFSLSWTMVNTMETVYFGLIALFPTVAVVRYGKHVLTKRTVVKLMVLGFVFYGSAAFLSGPLEVTEYDWMIGDGMYNAMTRAGGEELALLYEEADERILEMEEERGITMMDVRTRMVDYLLEESLELLGATMLLASALAYKGYESL